MFVFENEQSIVYILNLQPQSFDGPWQSKHNKLKISKWNKVADDHKMQQMFAKLFSMVCLLFSCFLRKKTEEQLLWWDVRGSVFFKRDLAKCTNTAKSYDDRCTIEQIRYILCSVLMLEESLFYMLGYRKKFYIESYVERRWKSIWLADFGRKSVQFKVNTHFDHLSEEIRETPFDRYQPVNSAQFNLLSI